MKNISKGFWLKVNIPVFNNLNIFVTDLYPLFLPALKIICITSGADSGVAKGP